MRSDDSCYCMHRNPFENLQKLFKNITLYFTIDLFLSPHDIPISSLTNLLNGLQQTRFDHHTYCRDNIALTVKPYIFIRSYLYYRVALHTRKK